MKIIIDSNYVGHASRFAIPKMTTSKGERTEVIYGFLSTILNLKSTFDCREFIFTWDSKNSKRKQLFSGYKESRHKNLTEEEQQELLIAYEQFNKIKTILPEMGFNNVFEEDGFESDDLIARIVYDYPEEQFLICATDKDLYQLLRKNVAIIKKDKLFTAKKFTDEYKIKPNQWVMVKALAGCISDQVPGIKGVGELSACKFINNELKETSKIYQKIVDEKDKTLKKNLPLVQLPFDGTPFINLKKDKFEIRKIRDIFKLYEFKSFLQEFSEWRNFA